MPLMQLIYTSRPFGFEAGMLDDILVTARRRNAGNEITGALICRSDLFLQMLEGPRFAVTETFGRILRDDRHIEVGLVWSGEVEERMFAGWDMRDDPVRSWMWSREEVGAGAAREAQSGQARFIFRRLSRLPPERPEH